MRRLLVLLAVAWVGVNLAAAWVSVDRKLPYDLAFLDRAGAPDRVGDDWLYGWGSGLAVPMAAVAAMAVLTALSALSGGAGRLGAFLVAVLGGSSVAYTLANAPATERLQALGTDTTEAALLIASLSLSGLLLLVGLIAWLTSPRDSWS